RFGGNITLSPELAPGQWRVIIARRGVGPAGYVALDRTFSVTSPAEPDRRREPPPDVPSPPQITAIPQTSPDAPWNLSLHITGSGFTPNMPPQEGQGVFILVVLQQNPQVRNAFWTPSDAAGRIDHHTGVIDTR